MKKQAVILGGLMLALLTGCSGGADKKAANTTPSPMEARQERILGTPMEGEKFTYVEREKYQGEGYYRGGNFASVNMLIYEANDSYVMLSYADSFMQASFMKAVKNERDEYEFSFHVEEKKGSSDTYIGKQVEYGTGTYNVTFRIENEKILMNIQGKNLIEQDEYLTTGVVELEKFEEEEKVEICDLSLCLGNCEEVYQSVYQNDMRLIEIGKEQGTDRVSYVDVSFATAWEKNNPLEVKQYQIGEINYLSTKEDCDRVFGKSIRQTDTGWEYSYQDGYVVQIDFEDTQMTRMGIYLGSKEEAMKEYTEGNFILRGCRIVDGTKCYEKGSAVKWPKDVISIAPHAFRLQGKINKKKVKLEVPKNVYLEPEAFTELGYADVIFEKGRKKIERYSFSNAGIKNDVTITVPSSVKIIEDGAFEQWYSLLEGKKPSNMPVYLSEGVEEIGDSALLGVCCDLPSTVKVLGNWTLTSWVPRNGKYELPENLEEIGSDCFEIIEKNPKLHIPASLKKIGTNAFIYTPNKKQPRITVDSKNKYFKTGKGGWLYSKDGKELYFACGTEKEVKIPEGVEYICCDLNSIADAEGYSIVTEWEMPKSLKENRYKKYFMDMYGYWDLPY